jgi:hypothetical protein
MHVFMLLLQLGLEFSLLTLDALTKCLIAVLKLRMSWGTTDCAFSDLVRSVHRFLEALEKHFISHSALAQLLYTAEEGLGKSAKFCCVLQEI